MVSPAAILSRDSTSRRYSRISDLVGSPSDLRISLVTLGPSTFGFGHRIYFGSSLDLSDSSVILEIGPSSEILRISRPFAHPVPFPFPLPSSRFPPFPFLPPPLGCLLIFTLTRPSSFGRPSALPLRPSPRPYACPSQVVFWIHRLAVYRWPVALSSMIALFRFSVMTHYLLFGVNQACTNMVCAHHRFSIYTRVDSLL